MYTMSLRTALSSALQTEQQLSLHVLSAVLCLLMLTSLWYVSQMLLCQPESVLRARDCNPLRNSHAQVGTEQGSALCLDWVTHPLNVIE